MTAADRQRLAAICSIEGCQRPVVAIGYCDTHYRRHKRGADLLTPIGGVPGIERPGETEVLILQAIAYQGSHCLLWPDSMATTRGYGRASFKGRDVLAHRMVCELTHGPAPSNEMQAMHWCGTRRCVTPRHLRWGTPKDNAADMIRHGRTTRGTKHHRVKLTEADVKAIRSQPSRKGRDLAEKYGVSPMTISVIRSRKRWQWLED